MTQLQNLFFMAKSYFQKRQVFALYLFFVFEHGTLFFFCHIKLTIFFAHLLL